MQEIKPVNLKGALIVVAVMAIFLIVIGYRNIMQESREKAVQRATRNAPLLYANQTRAAMGQANPSSDFETVRNNCGACGTSSVVGGWETEDGRVLVLSENGTFTAIFDEGPPMVGDWQLGGGELCLLLATGAESCFTYQQKIDAMKLDNAIYIRR